ncbi:hypothetical protein P9112_011651 [Eukaryota sp. TZLM1-RC]
MTSSIDLVYDELDKLSELFLDSVGNLIRFAPSVDEDGTLHGCLEGTSLNVEDFITEKVDQIVTKSKTIDDLIDSIPDKPDATVFGELQETYTTKVGELKNLHREGTEVCESLRQQISHLTREIVSFSP